MSSQEGTKFGFRDADAIVAFGHSYTLKKCLEVSLRLLAPLMPYLADDLYTRLARKFPVSFLPVSSLLEAEYPEYEEVLLLFVSNLFLEAFFLNLF